MNRFSKKLYQFRIEHEFYTNAKSDDFVVKPGMTTAKWLKSHSMLFKAESDGFDLIYRKETDPGNAPFTEITATRVIPFNIELRNPEILNVTDLPSKTNATDLYIASGLYSDAALSFSTIPTRQPQFTEPYTYTFSRVKFQLEDANGDVVYEENLVGQQDPDIPTNYNFQASVNVSNIYEQGRYTLKTLRNGAIQDSLEVYIYNRLEYPNLYGVFELELDTAIDYNTLPYESVLSLDAFENSWTYNIELTRTFLAATLALTDTTAVSPVTFTMDPAMPTYAAGEVITFTSNTDIKKTELPFTKLQLQMTSTDVNFTMEKLPNPTHANQNSIVYLKI